MTMLWFGLVEHWIIVSRSDGWLSISIKHPHTSPIVHGHQLSLATGVLGAIITQSSECPIPTSDSTRTTSQVVPVLIRVRRACFSERYSLGVVFLPGARTQS